MNRDRLVIAGVLASFAALALLAILVFRYGQHHPSPPSLRDHPNRAIPGEIMFIDEHRCIVRAAASGATREKVVCSAHIDFLARTGANTIVYGALDPGGVTATTRDLVTGIETPTDSAGSPRGHPVTGGTSYPFWVTVEVDGSVYRNAPYSEPVRIFDCDCRKHRWPKLLTWSPDGQWLLLRYWDSGDVEQLWIIARDGSFAGTLADAARPNSVSWFIAGSGILPPPSPD